MNYLITLNIGNYLHPNVRESYNHACDRWGIGYHEITTNFNPSQDLCFNKILGIRDFINKNPGVHGILYMDADMLIRSDAPNPFLQFNNRSYVYGTRDYDATRWSVTSKSYLNVRYEVSMPWIIEVNKKSNYVKLSNSDIKNCTDWFINAGLFLLYVPESLNQMDRFISEIPDDLFNSRYEQALWNCILKRDNKIKHIDSIWNRINPELETGRMTSYVYHFTGTEDYCKIGKKKETVFNWKV